MNKSLDDSSGFKPAAYVARDPEAAAIIAKMVPDDRRAIQRDANGDRKLSAPQTAEFRTKLQHRAKRNYDAKLQMKSLPDTKLAGKMLVSSIMSPGDMVSTEVTFNGPKDVYASELSATLMQEVKEYFKVEHDLEKVAPKQLEDILLVKGSAPFLILPENAVDDFINGDRAISTESMSGHFFKTNDGRYKPRHTGILGDPCKTKEAKRPGLVLEAYSARNNPPEEVDDRISFAMEGAQGVTMARDDLITITDNPDVVKMGKFEDKLRQQLSRKLFSKALGLPGLGLESNISDFMVETALRGNRTYPTMQIDEIKRPSELKRRSVGKALIYDCPSECVFPIHVPGDPEKHVFYLFLLDEEGNFIRANSDVPMTFDRNGMNTIQQNSLSSNIIQRVNTNMGGGQVFDPYNQSHMDFAAQLCAEVLERDVIARFKNGAYGRNVEVSGNVDIYRVMISRVMARRYTQILCVPTDYVCYLAFDYDDDGVGRSLLDEGSIINTARITTMFADWLAGIKNSIGRTRVSFKHDEDDPDPERTFEMVKDISAKSRQVNFPDGISNPADITKLLQEACVEFEVEGHPGIPDLKYNVEQRASSYQRMDDSLKDELKKQSIQLMGLTPEQVDNGLAGEFATTVVANNIMLSKLVTTYQNKYTPQLSDYCIKILKFSPGILEKMRDIVIENVQHIKYKPTESEEYYLQTLSAQDQQTYKVNRSLQLFVEGIRVSLPKPPSVALENQITMFNTYKDGISTVIDEAFINAAALDASVAGDLSNNIEMWKAQVKAYYLRRFCAEKGIFGELSELTSADDDGKPQLNLIKETLDHTQALVRSFTKAMATVTPLANAATADLQKITDGQQPSADMSGGDTGDGGDDGGGGDAGGDDFGMDDFDAGNGEEETTGNAEADQ